MRPLIDKRLIFVVSTGRCGTRFLAGAFSSVPDIAAFHEPDPNFAYELRQSQFFSNAPFWKDTKLPAIANNIAEDVYIETSHYFGGGFFEPLLEMGIVPDIILLKRPFRDTALSFWRRGSIPSKKFDLVGPDDHVYLGLDGWKQMTDYQLCYWRCIEVACRQSLYKEYVSKLGGIAVDASLEDITKREGFRELVNTLNLQEPDWSKYSESVVNATDASNGTALPDESLDEMEKKVWENIRVCRRKCLLNVPQGARGSIEETVLASIPQVLFSSQALSR